MYVLVFDKVSGGLQEIMSCCKNMKLGYHGQSTTLSHDEWGHAESKSYTLVKCASCQKVFRLVEEDD